jgi:hypothetical protein
MTIEDIESEVSKLHEIYTAALHTARIDRTTGKYTKLPEINIYLKPEEMPFDELRHSKIRKYVLCKQCGFDLSLCLHNPFIKGPAQYAAEIQAQQKTVLTTTDEVTGEVITVARRRGRKSAMVSLTPEILDECIRRFNAGEGGVTALALEFKVKGPELSQALKLAGCKVVKGARAGTVRTPSASGVSRGKPRSTAIITPDILAECIAEFEGGKGMTILAKEHNLSPVELSAALKAAGAVKGRK